MSPLSQLRTQTLAVWNSLAASQRATMVLVLALVVGSFGWMILADAGDHRVPLFTGKAFTVEESMNAQSILLASGLTDFEQRGAQLYVPSAEIERYNAALIEGGGLPLNWAEEWEKQNSTLGQFTGAFEREQVKERARAKQVARMLMQIPEIAVADVVWDEDSRPGWRNAPKARAVVSLRPVPGHAITPELIKAARLAAASSKSHLAPEDVVVIDLSTGKSDDGTSDGPFGDAVLARRHRLTEEFRQRVLDMFSYIDGLKVAVNVDLDRVQSSRVRRQKINPKESLAVAEDTIRNTETSQRTTSLAEPGAAPNTGLDLQNGRGPAQTRDVSETAGSVIQTASFEVTEDEMIGMLPQFVTVAVSIPKSYYQQIALASPGLVGRERGDITEDELEAVVDQMEAETVPKIQQQVRMLLPQTGAEIPNDQLVKVDTFVMPVREAEPESLPITWTIADVARTWLRPVALLVLATVTLVMLNRSLRRPMPELPPLPASVTAAIAPSDEDAAEEEEDDLPQLRPPDNKKREHLQTVVRDNPELAASVINAWMGERAA